jgi:hypothetical protein
VQLALVVDLTEVDWFYPSDLAVLADVHFDVMRAAEWHMPTS